MYKQARMNSSIPGDTTPAGIEAFLHRRFNDVLDKEMQGIEITPLLQVKEYDDTLSGKVKDGYGAVTMNINGHMVYVPFILKDKEFLPFDAIRMGKEQVTYTDEKLVKLVKALKRVKGKEAGKESSFETMTVGDTKELPYDNGFLGTIMHTRDMAEHQNRRGSGRFSQRVEGRVDDIDPITRYASHVDPLELVEELQEKMAAVSMVTKEEVEKVANDLRERAIREYDEVIKVMPTPRPDKSYDRIKEVANEVSLVEYQVADSGIPIEYPLVDNQGATTISRSSGVIFKKLVRLQSITGDAGLKISAEDARNPKKESINKNYNALLVDKTGRFKLIHDTENVLIYKERKMSPTKIFYSTARTLRKDRHGYYAILLNEEEGAVTMPFQVHNDYKSQQEESGRILTDFELRQNGGRFFSAVQSTLFANAMVLNDNLSGNSFAGENTLCILAREHSGIDEGIYTLKELHHIIMDKALHENDVNVSMSMINSIHFVDFSSDNKVIVLKPTSEVMQLKLLGLPTVSKREELTGMQKTAAYDGENKVVITMTPHGTTPYKLALHYVKPETIGELVDVSAPESKEFGDLTEVALRKALSDLGINHRAIDDAMAAMRRNAGSITMPYQDVKRLEVFSLDNPGDGAVKKFLRGLFDNTMHVNNYKPVADMAIADTATDVINRMLEIRANEMLGVATELEKIANEKRDPFHVELATLANASYQLCKLASHVKDGTFIFNAKEVYETAEKLASAIPEAATDAFYEHRVTGNDIYKKACFALDELSKELANGAYMFKEANVKGLAGIKKKVGSQLTKWKNKTSDKLTPASIKAVKPLDEEYGRLKHETRQLMDRRDELYAVGQTKPKAMQAALQKNDELIEKQKQLVEAAGRLTEAQNMAESTQRKFLAGIGIPLVGAASYKMNRE